MMPIERGYMMIRVRFLSSLLLCIVFMFCAIPNGEAEVLTLQEKTLVGIKELAIIIQYPNDIPLKASLNGVDLRAIVESKLRSAGIKISSNPRSEGPNIYVNINVADISETQLFFILEIGIIEFARLERNPDIRVWKTTTWKEVSMGSTPVSTFTQNVKNILDDMMNKFLVAYLKANPRTP